MQELELLKAKYGRLLMEYSKLVDKSVTQEVIIDHLNKQLKELAPKPVE